MRPAGLAMYAKGLGRQMSNAFVAHNLVSCPVIQLYCTHATPHMAMQLLMGSSTRARAHAQPRRSYEAFADGKLAHDLHLRVCACAHVCVCAHGRLLQRWAGWATAGSALIWII